ncbi:MULTISPECIES: MltR family transcriptional regulator [Vibrio]|jgi:mannitol operon repressor|uniref:MltR family transcriptional regulator n=1 Tax=Vibrio TaxID=662 RepID=UPI001EFCE0C0|nr:MULTISPECIES: MltR family transcriptional regulator [Vibrio]MCG9632739.1 MltR family transcriptional regulator [Vibrio sp. Isolate30]
MRNTRAESVMLSKAIEPVDLPNEAELLEVISTAEDASAVFLAAYHALDDTIGVLMQSIFYKDDYAVKYVVDPLLKNQGPLGDVMIRSKLLYGLGVINREIYEDIERFVTLKEWADTPQSSIYFTDPDVIEELQRVHVVQSVMPIDYDQQAANSLPQEMLTMFIERHNQKVQSSIVLAIAELVRQICHSDTSFLPS